MHLCIFAPLQLLSQLMTPLTTIGFFLKLDLMRGRLVFILILISLFVLLPGMSLAKDSLGGTQPAKNVELKRGEVVNRDFIAVAESVTISGTVNGDVYAAGANVLIDGRINGDVLAVGGIINLSGEVSDDVRMGGGSVLFNGSIGRNLTVGGGSVTMMREGGIGGSLLAFGGNLDIRGPVGRDARVYASRALFGSQVGRDLTGFVEELILTSEARVGGNLTYRGPLEAQIAEEAVITGKTSYQPSEEEFAFKISPARRLFATRPTLAGLLANLFSLGVSFALGFAFLYVFPKRSEAIVKVLATRPWVSLGVGFLAMILIVPLIVFLAISLIGIPLILFLIPLFLFFLYFAKIFAALCTGQWLFKRFKVKKGWNWALLTGLVVYYLLKSIPFISPMTALAFTTLGLGAFLLDQKALRKIKKK
jgi:hypothetical protein